MDEIQLSALKYIVSYAYEHTLFYKKLYNNIDISSLSSIEELPIVTTEFLKKYPHEFKTDEPVYKVVMTSGTLSNPKILYRTQQDFEKSVDNECLLLNWAGIQKNDIVCIIQPFGINGYGELTLEACKKLGIFAVPLGDVQDDIVLAAIKTFSPTVLDISPSRLLTILSKIKPEENSIRLAMVAGEHITPNFKSNIFRKYGIQIINQYGSTELDGLAAEKLNEEGLHLIPNSFIFEIVDDQIVVTSLYHKGTPLIRYMLGDIATINNNIIEVCGRNASIQLIDGIILEQSIIDSIVAKYNGLFWQCILYNNKNTLCEAINVAIAVGFEKVFFNIGSLSNKEIDFIKNTVIDLSKIVLSLFQETYDEQAYKKFLGLNPEKNAKADFQNRIDTIDRWISAGFSKIDIGVLLGFKEVESDIEELISHALRFIQFNVETYISTPRIKNGSVGDNEYRLILNKIHNSVPNAKLIITTREKIEFINSVIDLVSVVSPGSSDICPYNRGQYISNSNLTSQFVIDEKRLRPFDVLTRINIDGSIRYFNVN